MRRDADSLTEADAESAPSTEDGVASGDAEDGAASSDGPGPADVGAGVGHDSATEASGSDGSGLDGAGSDGVSPDEGTAAHELLADDEFAALFEEPDTTAAPDTSGDTTGDVSPVEETDPAPPPEPELAGELAGDVLVLGDVDPTVAPRRRKMSRLERRRRVKLQARRVRRVIRHIEPWSVLKMSLLFSACLWVILLIAGVLVWGAAESAGTVEKTEDLIREYFVLDSFELNSQEIFRGYALGGLALAIAFTAFNVLMCLLFNLISDLVGGVRITMIEEETARPKPPRRKRRRRRR